MKGLYIHIPFCKSKCKYCDFYSFTPKNNDMDKYLSSLLKCMKAYSEKLEGMFDTVYIGGGTPSFFGAERLKKLFAEIRNCFDISKQAEITVECNPSSVTDELMASLAFSGVNRISMGVQSAVAQERFALGRKSNCDQIKNAINLAKEHGIDNISLDLMLGIPMQTMKSLDESLDFIIHSGAKHISAYMLKIEDGTPLFYEKNTLDLPDEDSVCEMYLYTVNKLSEHGFKQYEISNFALPGFESKHNTKYWTGEDYLGIGPSAHSLINGKRFYYERSINSFSKCEPVFDGFGGGEDEFVMLRLRLTEGMNFAMYTDKFKKPLPTSFIQTAKELEKLGLVRLTENSLSLTANGFLVSNSIIGKLLDCLS